MRRASGIRFGDARLDRVKVISLVGTISFGVFAWWAVIMAAVAIVRRWWGA
jgi:hypothetical protein